MLIRVYLKEGVIPDTIGATANRMAQLIKESNGKLFTVTFTKRTNSRLRELRGRLGVKSYLKGGVLPFDPDDYDLIPVWDIEKQEYRMINIRGIISLNIGGQQYSLTTSAKKLLVKREKNGNLSINN